MQFGGLLLAIAAVITNVAASSDIPTVNLIPDGGFYPFSFYPAQDTVKALYKIDPTDQMLIVSVWDCFCPEDRYGILDGGRLVGMTVGRCFEIDGSGLPVPTSACTLDLLAQPPGSDPSGDMDCLQQIALYGGQFCYSRAILDGGEGHELTIKIQKSPFSFGTGYIRVDRACKHHDWTACCLLSNTCNFGVNR